MPGRIIRTAAVCALFTALGPLTSGRAIASEPDFFNFAPPSDPDATVDRLIQPPPKQLEYWATPDFAFDFFPRAHTDLPDEPEHTDLPDEPEAGFKPIFYYPRGHAPQPEPFGDGSIATPTWLTSPNQPLPPLPDSGDGSGGSPPGPVPAPGAALLLGVSVLAAGSRRRRP